MLFLPKQTTAATTRPLPSERRWLGSSGTESCLERQHVVCQWDYYLLYLPLSLQQQRETAEPSVTKGKENQSLIRCGCCWIFPLSRLTIVNNSSYARIPASHNIPCCDDETGLVFIVPKWSFCNFSCQDDLLLGGMKFSELKRTRSFDAVMCHDFELTARCGMELCHCVLYLPLSLSSVPFAFVSSSGVVCSLWKAAGCSVDFNTSKPIIREEKGRRD